MSTSAKLDFKNFFKSKITRGVFFFLNKSAETGRASLTEKEIEKINCRTVATDPVRF